jgi:hypothetical protein
LNLKLVQTQTQTLGSSRIKALRPICTCDAINTVDAKTGRLHTREIGDGTDIGTDTGTSSDTDTDTGLTEYTPDTLML